jgi:hypothetical protein
MSKFGNKKTTVDGITFDSKLEARFYEFAKQMKADGHIKDFEMQKRFEVFPQFRKDGKLYRKIEYVADFVIHHHDGSVEIIDTKGVETDVFKIKRKLFEHKYEDLHLKAITYSKIDGGWIELEDLKKARKERKKSKG